MSSIVRSLCRVALLIFVRSLGPHVRPRRLIASSTTSSLVAFVETVAAKSVLRAFGSVADRTSARWFPFRSRRFRLVVLHRSSFNSLSRCRGVVSSLVHPWLLCGARSDMVVSFGVLAGVRLYE